MVAGRTFSLLVEEAQGRDLHVGHAANEVDEHHLRGRKRYRRKRYTWPKVVNERIRGTHDIFT